MSIETDCLTQKAVLWPKYLGADQFGRQRIADPIEIDSRWEFGVNLSNTAIERAENVTATVFVDRKIDNGAILWKGSLEDLPDYPEDLVEVLSYEEVPDIKGEEVQRTVVVGAYANRLPQAG